jgi:hypothetical protein
MLEKNALVIDTVVGAILTISAASSMVTALVPFALAAAYARRISSCLAIVNLLVGSALEGLDLDLVCLVLGLDLCFFALLELSPGTGTGPALTGWVDIFKLLRARPLRIKSNPD